MLIFQRILAIETAYLAALEIRSMLYVRLYVASLPRACSILVSSLRPIIFHTSFSVIYLPQLKIKCSYERNRMIIV